MANVAISGDTSGAVTLTVPTVAGTQTVTFPAATGTAMVSGNMPTFNVIRATTNQNFSASTWTVIQYNSEIWDTNNCFDSTTNYRFTPTVAGYYQINVNVGIAFTGTSSTTGVGIFKNGSIYLVNVPYSSYSSGSILSVSGMVYLNGTTDYITGNVYSNGTSPSVSSVSHESQMSGVLARAA